VHCLPTLKPWTDPGGGGGGGRESCSSANSNFEKNRDFRGKALNRRKKGEAVHSMIWFSKEGCLKKFGWWGLYPARLVFSSKKKKISHGHLKGRSRTQNMVHPARRTNSHRACLYPWQLELGGTTSNRKRGTRGQAGLKLKQGSTYL